MEIVQASEVTRQNQAEALATYLGVNPSFPAFAPLACRVVVMADGVKAIPVSPTMLIKFEDFNDDNEFITVEEGKAFTYPLAEGEAELTSKEVSERLVKVFKDHGFQLEGAVQSIQMATLSDPKMFDQFPEATNMAEVLDALLMAAMKAERDEMLPPFLRELLERERQGSDC